MKIAFFGSGDFALPVLERLLEANADCVLVVTQPPRRRRRGGKEEPTLVARRAEELGVAVFSPPRINDNLDRLREVEADLFVVAEYGQILSQALLDIPPQGSINVHGSLLPRWRGATPIEAALLAGDTVTGVTIQRVVRELDAGDVLAARELTITDEDDAGTLRSQLSSLGAELAAEVVDRFAAGDPPAATPQDPARVTHCRRLDKGDLALDFARDAAHLARQVRAFRPRPLARAGEFKIVRAAALDGDGEPGVVSAVGRDGIAVGTGSGLLQIEELIPPGRKAMAARDYANGAKTSSGSRFPETAS